MNQLPLPEIARKFIKHKLINEHTAHEINSSAQDEGRSFFVQAIEQNHVPVNKACEIASRELSIPVAQLASINLETAPFHLVPSTLLEKHRVLPLSLKGSRMLLAIGDPGQTGALDEIRFSTNLNFSLVLVDPRKLSDAIDDLLSGGDFSLDDLVAEEGDTRKKEEEITLDSESDSPIIRFVNKIIQDAIRRGASDIHIEPYEKMTRVRYRVDGVLHDAIRPPTALIDKIIARLKIMSSLDIAERRIPQDGRMKVNISKKKVVDFRVSTMPTLFGEKMVIRVLDPGSANLALDTIGMLPEQLKAYKNATSQPHGMILVTGPTGSGKTVTLYSAISVLNTPESNVSSVEDPVEIYVTGVNQVNINEKAGLTFATTLRAFLRQDPDILMLGEIRDLETAEIAIKAAQTGHLVLSTLHTNDAANTLTRLTNMGVAPFNIASSVSLIIAQRLVRKLCQECRQLTKIPDEALITAGFSKKSLGSLKLYEAAGCSSCTGGYKGRTGIYEAMPISIKMAQMVMKEASVHDIQKQARAEGVKSMRDAGLIKIAKGITTLEEVERVTKD